jgi:hypothetical protein
MSDQACINIYLLDPLAFSILVINAKFRATSLFISEVLNIIRFRVIRLIKIMLIMA